SWPSVQIRRWLFNLNQEGKARFFAFIVKRFRVLIVRRFIHADRGSIRSACQELPNPQHPGSGVS
ncbi:hypothetical protein ABLO16_08035, partial [Mycobacterium tuberculosis]